MKALLVTLLTLFSGAAATPGVIYRLVATEFAPRVICDAQARPRCWKMQEIVTKYEWRAE